MKKIHIGFKAVLLLSVGLLVASCSSDEPAVENTGEGQSLVLRISPESQPGPYSTGPAQGAASVVLSSAGLYLTDANGVIVKYYTLTSAASNYATGGTNIKLDETQSGSGATLTGLPATITGATLVGNTQGLAQTGNISAVRSQLLNVETQKAIASVHLYAAAPLTTVSGLQKKVDLTLKPIVSRIEIPDITASGIITGFTVDGIFIDGFYSKGQVDGTLAPANLAALSTSGTDFPASASAGTTKYPLTVQDALYDLPGVAATGTPALAKPASAAQVWSYNLFSLATGSAVPTIVIRLTGITTSDPAVIYSTPQYLTVKGFKSAGATLTALKAGEIYAITPGSLVFSETNISPTPNLEAIDVAVKVTLASWTVVAVTPDI